MRLKLYTVFVLLVVGAVARFVFLVTHPPIDHHLFEYETIAPIREQWWLFHFYGAGFGFILAFGALAVLIVAACQRARLVAILGGLITTTGAILTSLGFAAEGVVWAYVTDPAVLDPNSGERMLHALGEYPAMIDGPILTGFLLIPVGVLLQLVALWIARAVPRWLVYATVAVLLASQLPLPAGGAAVTSVLETLAIIALGGFAVRGTIRSHRGTQLTVAAPEVPVMP